MLTCGKGILLIISISQFRMYSTAWGYMKALDYATVLQSLEDRVAALESHEHDEAHDHHAALFSVSYSEGNSINTPDAVFVFDQVSLNREEGYNSTTGIFTCPIAGVYSFVYTSLPARGVETAVTLVRNNVKASSIYSDLSQGSTQSAERTELVLLAEGDAVWVKLEKGTVLRQQASLSFQGYRVSD
ncbi:collagen alpha-2(VIII) chain-like [Stegostoma tigrinum]|uniref:collagen alpha-2(VIII) chain-like n=1 Tax=Stegostoma tigrinum TaxID=3053191 RepID=UPI00202B8D4C|nr:collagen alpha-2(VIII) chain-like [Stegostoma tigrinum]